VRNDAAGGSPRSERSRISLELVLCIRDVVLAGRNDHKKGLPRRNIDVRVASLKRQDEPRVIRQRRGARSGLAVGGACVPGGKRARHDVEHRLGLELRGLRPDARFLQAGAERDADLVLIDDERLLLALARVVRVLVKRGGTADQDEGQGDGRADDGPELPAGHATSSGTPTTITLSRAVVLWIC